MIDDSEAEEGKKEVSCDLKGETGNLSTVISEGKSEANKGYEVKWFWNDPTQFEN